MWEGDKNWVRCLTYVVSMKGNPPSKEQFFSEWIKLPMNHEHVKVGEYQKDGFEVSDITTAEVKTPLVIVSQESQGAKGLVVELDEKGEWSSKVELDEKGGWSSKVMPASMSNTFKNTIYIEHVQAT